MTRERAGPVVVSRWGNVSSSVYAEAVRRGTAENDPVLPARRKGEDADEPAS